MTVVCTTAIVRASGKNGSIPVTKLGNTRIGQVVPVFETRMTSTSMLTVPFIPLKSIITAQAKNENISEVSYLDNTNSSGRMVRMCRNSRLLLSDIADRSSVTSVNILQRLRKS